MRMNLKTLVAFGVLVVLAALPAAAQMITAVKATVPFGFTAGNTDFPAGKYSLQRAQALGTLMIRSQEANDAAFLTVIPAQAKSSDNTARLVFNKYGDQYFLTQVWDGSGRPGFHVPKSRREREMIAAGRNLQSVAVLIPQR